MLLLKTAKLQRQNTPGTYPSYLKSNTEHQRTPKTLAYWTTCQGFKLHSWNLRSLEPGQNPQTYKNLTPQALNLKLQTFEGPYLRKLLGYHMMSACYMDRRSDAGS
jgi:hypothetical protein